MAGKFSWENTSPHYPATSVSESALLRGCRKHGPPLRGDDATWPLSCDVAVSSTKLTALREL